MLVNRCGHQLISAATLYRLVSCKLLCRACHGVAAETFEHWPHFICPWLRPPLREFTRRHLHAASKLSSSNSVGWLIDWPITPTLNFPRYGRAGLSARLMSVGIIGQPIL